MHRGSKNDREQVSPHGQHDGTVALGDLRGDRVEGGDTEIRVTFDPDQLTPRDIDLVLSHAGAALAEPPAAETAPGRVDR